MSLLAGCCLALALLVAWPSRLRPHPHPPAPRGESQDRGGLLVLGVVGVVTAAMTVVPGPLSLLVAGVGATLTWRALRRAEPVAERRRREQALRELPDVVRLLGVALASGASSSGAVRMVGHALPGPAADAVANGERRLSLGLPWQGGDPGLDDPGFQRLGRALTRSARSGAPVAAAVVRLAAELASERRLRVADRARTVGVRAALPLGLCLLPAFLLLGIVPVVVASLRSLPW